MRSLSVEMKVGIFALIVFAIFAFMTFKVGGLDFMQKDGYLIKAYFNNVAGLDKKTKVMISGVNAGVADDIKLDNGKVLVTLRLSKDARIYSDAVAAIKFTGMLGDKYIEITPGSTGPFLKDGDKINNIVEITDMDGLIRKLSRVSDDIGRLSSSVGDAVGSEEAKKSIAETIRNINEITKNLNKAVVHNDRKLSAALEGIRETTLALNELIKANKESVTGAVENINQFSRHLSGDGPELLRNLNKASGDLKMLVEDNSPSIKRTIDNLDKITTKIEKGEGSLGKFVNDEQLYDSANKAASGVNKTLSAIDRFKAYLTLSGEYLSKSAKGKGYANVTLEPTEDMSFIIGLVEDGAGRQKRRTEFTVQAGKRFTDSEIFKNTRVRAGITEDTFGAGVDQFAMQDRLKISLDAWDFSRKESNAQKPHIKAGVDYFVFRNIFISAGIDNILNQKSRGGFVGGGVKFDR
jgi:phospholipid/cholesterol/gamma-HCH transport system substrate-binding protein